VHRQHPQYRQTRDAITRLRRHGNSLCVATQNLVEFWAVCTRPYTANGLGLSAAQTVRAIQRIEERTDHLGGDDHTIYTEWRRLASIHAVAGKNTHDARLAAVMSLHRVTHILTFNVDDFKRFPGIVALRPEDVPV